MGRNRWADNVGIRAVAGHQGRRNSVKGLLCVLAVVATALTPSMAAGAADVLPASTRPGGLPARSPGTDLGATRTKVVSFLVQLRSSAQPTCLETWSRSYGLALDWTRGQQWATVRGGVSAVERSFGVAIDDYRTPEGQVIYSTTRPAVVPAGACYEMAGVGAIHSFVAPNLLDVPGKGLTGTELMTAYDAGPLRALGIKGQHQTAVFLELDGFKPSDLSSFAHSQHLSPFNVQVVGGNSGKGEETPMDLETVHEIAPAANLVYVNLGGLPGAKTSSVGAVLASAFAMVDQRWRGAIVSVSLGFCESGGEFTQSDLVSMDTAVGTAEQNGATVFASSGDTGGLDCTPANDGGKPPVNSYVGVGEPAALPQVTGVGGTSLSTTSDGAWTGETTWSEPLLSQGSGGGVSLEFKQPPWQTGVGTGGQLNPNSVRQVPDVAADADPTTGNLVISGGSVQQGGGTSLATPIWAGFTALMDQYLESQQHPPVGFFNPLLYGLANGSPAYAPFHDITLGGNDLYPATPGYDMVTGLGSPDVWNLARDLAAGSK